MFFQKLSFRLQNTCSDKVQSFIPESRILGLIGNVYTTNVMPNLFEICSDSKE